MSELKTQHPLLMVPHVISFSVVVYTNGPMPTFDLKHVRQSLIDQFDDGIGVSNIACVNHGVYDPKKDQP